MFTYLLTGVAFIGLVLVLDTLILRTWVIRRLSTWIIMAHMLLLTAIFDQLLATYIVAYDPAKLLGVYLWKAPVEDFLYTVAAVIGVGSLLHAGSNKHVHRMLWPHDWLHRHIRRLFRKGDESMAVSEMLATSRPLWWGMTAAGFVGSYFVLNAQHDWLLFVGVFFFAFSYNLAMYGINDIFDYESDMRNPRKLETPGGVLPKSKHRSLWLWIAVTNVPLLAILYWQGSIAANVWLTLMMFMVVAYSQQGLRFKEIPILDSLTSSFHYTSPFIYGGLLVGADELYIPAFIAFYVWGVGNHAFAAIQDVTPDREGNVRSLATQLGPAFTVYFCTGVYLLAALLPVVFYGAKGLLATLLVSPQLLTTLATWRYRHDDTHPIFRRSWKRFVYYYYLSGFILTFALLYTFKPFGYWMF